MHIRVLEYCDLKYDTKTNKFSYLNNLSLSLSISISESRATSQTLSFFTTAVLDFLPELEGKLLQKTQQELLLLVSSAPAKCTTSSSPAKTIASKPCLPMLNIEIKFQLSITNTTKKISGKLEILCIIFCINFVSLYVYWNPCFF